MITSWLQAVGAIASVAVAVAAIAFTVSTEERSAARFQEQLDQSERIAQASIKPLLLVTERNYVNHKAIILENKGAGTAVISSIVFNRNGEDTANLAELFRFKSNVAWNDYYRFGGDRYFVKQGESIVLAELSADSLAEQNYDSDTIQRILLAFEKQKTEINISVIYEDLLGNQQPKLKRSF